MFLSFQADKSCHLEIINYKGSLSGKEAKRRNGDEASGDAYRLQTRASAAASTPNE